MKGQTTYACLDLLKAVTGTAGGTWPTQAQVYCNVFFVASALCINRGGDGVVHRFNFSLRYGFTVLGSPEIASGGAAFPITLALIFL